MPRFTYDGAGARTVEAKGDVRDVIAILTVDETPFLNLIGKESTTDINPKAPEDSLSAVDNANAHAENAAAPAAADTTRSLNENYCQLMMKTADVTDTHNAISQYGMADELDYQEAKKLREIRLDAEAILVSDQAAQAPTAANARVANMAGMTALITTTTEDTFDQANFDTHMATVVAAGGSPGIAYMDATRKIAVGAWTTQYTRYSSEIKTLDQEVLVYQSDLGPAVQMRWHPSMPQTIAAAGAQCLVVDPSLWVLKELLPLSRKVLPDTGAGPSTLLKWQWAPLVYAEAGNFYFF